MAITGAAVRSFAYVLLPLLLASLVAALVAHVALDVVGDYLLVRDAYDGVDHGSRSTMVLLALAATLVLGTFALWSSFAERQDGRVALRSFLGPRSGRTFVVFVAAVFLVTLVLLAAMEALDTVAQSGRIDDVRDLLGGSIKLALAVALPSAFVAAFAIRRFFASLLRSCRALAALAGALLLHMLDRFERGRTTRRGRPVDRKRPRTSPLARRAGKRAPPDVAFA